MSHYEERLAADKDQIRQRVAAVGGRVEHAVREAVEALLERDHARCYGIALGDLPINREVRAIDGRCHAFVARHLPSAGHLRFVSSVLRLTVALERIGDHAVAIARAAVQLSDSPPPELSARIVELRDHACRMLERAVRAFADGDAELARETKLLARTVDRGFDAAFGELAEKDGARPVRDLFSLLGVLNQLERVGDQAKNVCEETLFELTGETKPPKVYRVLFVGKRDALLGPLATALARKAFPQSGRFQSAGTEPSESLDPVLEGLGESLGLDLEGLAPERLPADPDELGRYHVIVSLCGDCRAELGGVPFHTAYLEWELPRLATGGELDGASLEPLVQQLGAEIRGLMVTLRGEEAS